MNLVLLDADDFVEPGRVRLHGRRHQHVRDVLAAGVGDPLRVGIAAGKIGRGHIVRISDQELEMTVVLDEDPPSPPPLRLILALPRPKVLNRTIAAAASLGIKEIDLINSWRVEKSYWKSPKHSEENLSQQAVLGLEQAGDTILPRIRLHRFFREFVEQELAPVMSAWTGLVAHPGSLASFPSATERPVILAIGPEGGFIEAEVASFVEAGFTPVAFGPRILRVETALAYAVGRLF